MFCFDSYCLYSQSCSLFWILLCNNLWNLLHTLTVMIMLILVMSVLCWSWLILLIAIPLDESPIAAAVVGIDSEHWLNCPLHHKHWHIMKNAAETLFVIKVNYHMKRESSHCNSIKHDQQNICLNATNSILLLFTMLGCTVCIIVRCC